MSDRRIRSVFDQLVAEPTPEFESSLRRLLLEEMATTNTPTEPLAREDYIMKTEIDSTVDAPPGRGRRRPVAIWTAVALVAALVVAGLIIANRDSDDLEPATTTVPASTTSPPASTTTPVATTTPISTTTPVATTVAAAPASPLPLVTVEPGTYVVPSFAVPFEFTTTGTWQRLQNRKEILALGRGTNGATSFLVTSGLIAGSTPEEAVSQFCGAGDVEVGTPEPTTLLGNPAVQVEGRPLQFTCQFAAIDTLTQLELPVGHTFRLVAADVNGVIVVVVASAPTDQWADLAPEIDELVASMRLAG